MNWSTYKDKLSILINHAKNNSEFYKSRLSHIALDNLSEEKFKSIPVLDKQELIGHEETALTRPLDNKILLETTSGTTGEHLKCYKSNVDRARKAQELWSQRRQRGGITVRDRFAYFFNKVVDGKVLPGDVFKTDKELYFSTLNLSNKYLDLFYQELMEFRPDWIYGPPSVLFMFAQHIKDNMYSLEGLHIKYIECVGELLLPFQRSSIEEVFGPVVYSMYGTRENWLLGMTCSHGRVHLMENSYFFEVINQDENGYGELVITDITNKTWPLIRYKLGDIVKIESEKCSCGLQSTVMDITGARLQQYIEIDGKVINPMLFHYTVGEANLDINDCIRSFRVIQVSKAEFVIEVVPGKNYCSESEQYVYSKIKNGMPAGVSINMKKLEVMYQLGTKFSYFVPLERYRKYMGIV